MKKRKVLVGLLVATAALGLASCGGGGENKDPNQGQQETQQYKVEFSVNGGSAVVSQTIDNGGKVTKPADPTKANYTFAGWYKDAALKTIFNFDTETISSAITIYAAWTANEYVVTFNSLGGSTVSNATVSYGQKVTKPANPTKAGYVFTNWYKEEACTTVFNFDTEIISASTTLYAGWEVEKLLVTFNSNGGSDVQTQNIDVNGKAVKPADPTKVGYAFTNWYKDEACTVIYDFDTETITSAITLYAGWEAQKVVVSFNSLGGTAISDQNVDYGAKAVKPENPVKNGSVFVNWYKDQACTTVFDFETEALTSAITLYAGYRDKTYADLVADEGLVIQEDFTTTATIADFSGAFGTKGIYQYINLKGTAPDKTANYIAVENGAAKMYDTTSDGTQMMIDFGGKLNNGTIEGVMDLTLSGTGNSWTFFQIIGSNSAKSGSEIFGIRTDNGTLKYRLNGGSVETPASTITNTDTKYSIYFIVDIENSTLTMKINGAELATNIAFDVTSLEGIRLVSSDNGSRTMTIDNIAVVQTQLALEAYKEKQAGLLQAYYDSLDLSTYVTNLEALNTALANGKAAIASKSTHTEVLQAYEDADKVLRAILNDTDQPLQDYRLIALSTIEELGNFEGIYTAENLSIVQGYIAAAIKAINAVKLTAEVNLDAAKLEIDALVAGLNTDINSVETIKQQNEKAAASISALIDALVAADSSKVDILAAEDAINAAQAAYDAASDEIKALISEDLKTKLVNVATALEAAKSNVSPQESAQAAGLEAKEALDALYATINLDDYLINQATLLQILNEGKDKIDVLLNGIEADTELTAENLDQKYLTPIAVLVEEYTEKLGAVLNDLEQNKADLALELEESYTLNVSKYSEEYNLAAYTAKYNELKAAIASAEAKADLDLIDITELDSILTDEQQIAYNNKPEISIKELVDVKQSIDFIGTAPSSSVTIAQGTVNSFITFTTCDSSNAKAQYHKSGYLSLKAGVVVSFTTKSDNAKITLAYTGTVAGRTFTLNGNTYEPNTFTGSPKSITITLGAAGTYALQIIVGEHKLGSITLEDKVEQNVSHNVDSLKAALSTNEYVGTDALLADLVVNAILDNEASVSLNNSDVSVKYLQNNTEVQNVITGTYDIEVSYNDGVHTGIVKTIISNVNIIVPTAVANETQLLSALEAGEAHIQLSNDIEINSKIEISNDIVIYGNGHKIIASEAFVGSSVISNITSAKIKLVNLTVDANSKTRVIYVKAGLLEITDSTITGGYTTDYVAGIYVTSTAKFLSTNSNIIGNVISGAYADDNYLQYSADLWIGANATALVQSDDNSGNIGSIFVNSNEYSESEPSELVGLILKGGKVETVYVEYDKGIGASLLFLSGEVDKLLVSTTTTGQSVSVTPKPSQGYVGGQEYL